MEKFAAVRKAKGKLNDDEELEETLAEHALSRQAPRNLELLTALRRIKRQPDPLAVVVEQPQLLEATLRSLPAIKVALQNVDAEHRALRMQFGGDYRSGRQARWRIHVWDKAGNLLPEHPRRSLVGGGWSSTGYLPYGESWATELILESYVKIRETGTYKVQILYHDEWSIADFDDPKKLDEWS